MSVAEKSSRAWAGVFALSFLAFVASAQVACVPPSAKTPPLVRVKILHTTDVHGWLNGYNPRKTRALQGGLVELANAWKTQEGYDIAFSAQRHPRPYLILDSGDMWTGPAESTLAQGAPMVEAFNLLGYDAAAIGNHEFDFGLEMLRKNFHSAQFPFLSANIQQKPNGPVVDFCKPNSLVDVGGFKVGIIGLTTLETPQTTFPTRVEGLEFVNYEPQVRAQGEELMKAGAQTLVVIAHAPVSDLKPTAEAITDLPIRVWLGGHSHRREQEVLERNPLTDSDDVVMLNPGAFARAYGRVELLFQGNELVMHTEAVVPVEGSLDQPVASPNEALKAVVTRATQAVEGKMQEQLGALADPLPIGTVDRSPLGEWVSDRWLDAFPQAQIAITNIGGLRQSLEPGPLTMREIFGVLPFANDLVLIHLTPAQLREALTDASMLVGGLRYHVRVENGKRLVTGLETPDGKPLDESQRYGVITTDFLYAGGDNMPFKKMDPDAIFLGVGWREPVVEWLRKHSEPVKAPTPGRVITP